MDKYRSMQLLQMDKALREARTSRFLLKNKLHNVVVPKFGVNVLIQSL